MNWFCCTSGENEGDTTCCGGLTPWTRASTMAKLAATSQRLATKRRATTPPGATVDFRSFHTCCTRVLIWRHNLTLYVVASSGSRREKCCKHELVVLWRSLP
ncbi:unnamed protein product [Ectocarpus sp. 4 AP-2014]